MGAAPNTDQSRFYNTPMLNQHVTWPSRGGVYCTVASLYMFLYSSAAEGYRTSDPSPDDLIGAYEDNGYGYGGKIAEYIQAHTDLTYVEFLTTGATAQAFEAQLTKGFTVPIGIWHWEGAAYHVLGPHAGDARSYPEPVRDAAHPRDSSWAYPAGHWGLVVGYDSNHFYINDPDTGTNIRMAKSSLVNDDKQPYYVNIS